MWNEILRDRQFTGYKFLRQKPIGQYIVDFYCSELQLAIEIDGETHADTTGYDRQRTEFPNGLGLTVIRYTNDEVLHNIEGIYQNLTRRIKQRNP